MSATEQLTDDSGVGGQQLSAASSLSQDDVFHLLQSQRRRAVLRYLQDAGDEVEMRDIAEQVAAWENDTSVQALTSDERQRVYIPLYQSHLPKLDEEGVIHYDKDRGVVSTTPLVEQLGAYLDVDEDGRGDGDAGRTWDAYYFGVSGLGTILFLGAALDLPLFSQLPGAVVVGLVLAAFWTVTLGHALTK